MRFAYSGHSTRCLLSFERPPVTESFFIICAWPAMSERSESNGATGIRTPNSTMPWSRDPISLWPLRSSSFLIDAVVRDMTLSVGAGKSSGPPLSCCNAVKMSPVGRSKNVTCLDKELIGKRLRRGHEFVGFLRHVLRRPLGLGGIGGMIALPGETELGSAGTQPSKG
jgi:hypothetical protein